MISCPRHQVMFHPPQTTVKFKVFKCTILQCRSRYPSLQCRSRYPILQCRSRYPSLPCLSRYPILQCCSRYSILQCQSGYPCPALPAVSTSSQSTRSRVAQAVQEELQRHVDRRPPLLVDASTNTPVFGDFRVSNLDQVLVTRRGRAAHFYRDCGFLTHSRDVECRFLCTHCMDRKARLG